MSGRPGTYRLAMLFMLLTLPVVGWAAFQALKTNANSPLDWVPPTFPARADYQAFRREFGSGDLVIISWPGCTLDDPRLSQAAKYLRESRSFYTADYQWQFERVVTGREVFEQLTGAPLNFSAAEARRRLKGSLLGPDGKTTCAIVAFTPEAMVQRRKVVLTIHAVLKACGVPLADQHVAGPVIDGLSVDEAGRQSMAHLALPSALVVFFVCCWSLKSFRAACLVFALSFYAQGLTLALLHLGGETMSALLIVLPPLIQVLAVAGGIHLLNYYWDAVRKGDDQTGLAGVSHRLAALHARRGNDGFRAGFVDGQRFDAHRVIRHLRSRRRPGDGGTAACRLAGHAFALAHSRSDFFRCQRRGTGRCLAQGLPSGSSAIKPRFSL